jgi:hypothetical protein
MTRALALLVVALAALCAFAGTRAAQESPEQPAALEVSLRLHALSRGYLRPMGDTVRRVAALPGLTSARALGFQGDVLELRVRTALGPRELADALGGTLVGSGDGFVAVSPAADDRSARAEARLALLKIAAAVHERFLTAEQERHHLFGQAVTTEEKLELLGLDPRDFSGRHYTVGDYHVNSAGFVEDEGGFFHLWAGEESWLSHEKQQTLKSAVMRRSLLAAGIGSDFEASTEPDDTGPREPGPRYVALVQACSGGRYTVHWMDPEGVRLNGHAVSRAEALTDVQSAAEWMTRVAGRLAALRAANPQGALAELPQGDGHEVMTQLDAYDRLWFWNSHYGHDSIHVAWREHEGRAVAGLAMLDRDHPLYLEAELDVDDALRRLKESGLSLEAPPPDREVPVVGPRRARPARVQAEGAYLELDVKPYLKWVVGAEEHPEVFATRRARAAQLLDRVAAALTRRAAAGDEGPLTGRLSDPALRDRLGLADSAEDGGEYPFGLSEVEIFPQLFGDVEIRVGRPYTGGERWILYNVAQARVIRRQP